jgi:hypothetical protein
MSTKNSQIINVLQCQRHNSKLIRYICCFDGCNFGNLMCETCVNNDPKHTI